MIILTNTTDKITAKLGGTVTTNQLRCISSYRDTTSTDITPKRNVLNTNNTTAVDVVGAPASSTQRIVDYISIYNADTSNQVVTIYFNDNGTNYELFVTTLASGEKVEYAEGNGWQTFSNAGSIKTSLNQGNNTASSALGTVVLTSDVINNNAVANTMQDVTGLSFPVSAGGTYWFKFTIPFTAALTTTGSRWSISGPTATTLIYASSYSSSSTGITNNQGLSAYDTPAAASTASASTGSNWATVEGVITVSANGSVIARFASEVLSSAITAKAGAMVQYLQVI